MFFDSIKKKKFYYLDNPKRLQDNTIYTLLYMVQSIE